MHEVAPTLSDHGVRSDSAVTAGMGEEVKYVYSMWKLKGEP